jgi:hypothetical protein
MTMPLDDLTYDEGNALIDEARLVLASERHAQSREVRQFHVYQAAQAAVAQGKLPEAQQVPTGPEPEAPIQIHFGDDLQQPVAWNLPEDEA